MNGYIYKNGILQKSVEIIANQTNLKKNIYRLDSKNIDVPIR